MKLIAAVFIFLIALLPAKAMPAPDRIVEVQERETRAATASGKAAGVKTGDASRERARAKKLSKEDREELRKGAERFVQEHAGTVIDARTGAPRP